MSGDCIPVDPKTAATVRFAARMAGLSESEVVARAVNEYAAADAPPPDPWQPIPVYSEYDGQRVDADYVPATRRLTVRSGDVAGRTFKSPSGAARAVIAALNPARAATQTNGWNFWRIAATHRRLDALRDTRKHRLG